MSGDSHLRLIFKKEVFSGFTSRAAASSGGCSRVGEQVSEAQ